MSVLFILRGAKSTRLENCDNVCLPSDRLQWFPLRHRSRDYRCYLRYPKERPQLIPDRAKGLKEDSGVVSSSVGTGSDP